MTPRKVNIHAAFFCYAGNGGYAAILPDIAFWWAETLVKLRKDERVEKVTYKAYADTPITMTRNRAIETAQKLKADYLLLIDSDNKPDCEPDGKPFWESSFDFLYKHYEKGPALVFAPYCGPPDNEVPYVFRWTNTENDGPPEQFKLSMMEREEAARWSGIVDVAAGPTGLMLIDMRTFDLIDPPYFKYEFNALESDKASTEDVYFTRNASLNGLVKLGYNPVYCNFDAWAGHAKQKMVRKPRPLAADRVAETLQKAVLSGRQAGERMIEVGDNANKDPDGKYVPPKPRCDPTEWKTKDLPPVLVDARSNRLAPLPPPAIHLRPNTQDGVVVEEVVNQNCYKLPDKFPEGAIVLDIGAHIGIFALECIKRGASKVICYEPEPENFALLRANTRHEPKIESHCAAVWRDQPVELVIRAGQHTCQHFVRPSSNGHAIVSVTLDQICRDIPKVHLLKMDCEGAEQAILECATCLDRIEQIAMEVHPEAVDLDELRTILEANYFAVASRVSVARNWIWFCNREKPSRIRSLIQELAYELGFKPNVVTIEPPNGKLAIELADAGANIFTVRSELTQEFQEACGQRLGDTIEVMAGKQWQDATKFLATAHATVFDGEDAYFDFKGWVERSSHLICGTGFDKLFVRERVKALPGEFETDGDTWFKKIEQPVVA